MIRRSCIGAIYRKELIDILRDRRTILAMVIVPVVLYPLLMLGFLRAAESEQVKLRAERFTIEVDTPRAAAHLAEVFAAVARHPQTPDEKPPDFDVRVGQTAAAALGEHVQARVQLELEQTPGPLPPRIRATFTYNEVNVRSRAALDELSHVFDRFRTLLTREALGRILHGDGDQRGPASDIDLLLKPVEVKMISAATERQRGGWALGQIVPIILVLMTITGAVYPAIDLTAGERERGTLETLMATPVSPLQLILGKFFVVATVSLMAAILNVVSVGATMHFGGLTRAINTQLPVAFPLSVLPIIFLCMVPFALLFSAVLIAVCSFARTFKEAQNYVMPVIIIAMVPGIAVTLPTVQLRGLMLVMPVGNMVLLTRELFQQTHTWAQVAIVVASTTLYAGAAVAVAARLFGQEAVLFADSSSYRAMLSRRYFEKRKTPTASQALLLAALLFPASFYVQSLVAGASLDRFVRTMGLLGLIQFAGLFVLLPLGIAVYLKIDAVRTFRLHLPPVRAWLGALLVGASSWAVAHELFVLQSRVLPPSQALVEFGRQVESQLAVTSLWVVLLLMAVVPALSEEFLFRGFVLSGLSDGMRKWGALLLAAFIFGVFHFIIDRVPVSAMMGAILGYICWQSRSLFPGMLVHAMHNGLMVATPRIPALARLTGAGDPTTGEHLSRTVMLVCFAAFAIGLALFGSIRARPEADRIGQEPYTEPSGEPVGAENAIEAEGNVAEGGSPKSLS